MYPQSDFFVFNSSKKKKELINKILAAAEKINDEAIKKIKDILFLKNGICSPEECQKRGIDVSVNDDNLSAHKADRYIKSTPDDYISLTITTVNKEALSKFKGDKKIKKEKR